MPPTPRIRSTRYLPASTLPTATGMLPGARLSIPWVIVGGPSSGRYLLERQIARRPRLGPHVGGGPGARRPRRARDAVVERLLDDARGDGLRDRAHLLDRRIHEAARQVLLLHVVGHGVRSGEHHRVGDLARLGEDGAEAHAGEHECVVALPDGHVAVADAHG